MDIRQLRYFVNIARYGSLSAAADRLHVVSLMLPVEVGRATPKSKHHPFLTSFIGNAAVEKGTLT